MHEQREWPRATLSSFGGVVVTTDGNGGVTFVNPAAQLLTDWMQEDAAGKPLGTVFKIVKENNRRPVENPAAGTLWEGVIVGLAHSLLPLSRGGSVPAAAFSFAPTVE